MPVDPNCRSTEKVLETRRADAAPRDVAVLIPAYQPPEALVHLVERLTAAGVPAILVVDDGSSAEFRPLFDSLALHNRVHLLRHGTNQGKGEALKSGMRYFRAHLRHYAGLVTADADGQHHPDDVLRLIHTFHRSPHLAILGARTFLFPFTPEPLAPVPFFSRMVNRVAAAMVRAVTGIPVTDAQSGLRALPASLLSTLIELPGSRYEYEFAVLLHLVTSRQPLAEQPVRTLFHPRNEPSHFRPVADSIRLVHALLHSSRPARLACAPSPTSMPMGRRKTDQALYSKRA